jgi:HK97 family phage prohead protease
LDRQAPLMVAADTKELVVGPDIGARVKDLTQMNRFREFVWTHAQPNNAFCSFTAQASVGEGRKITLLVVPYGELSEDLGGFRELYEPGCFKGGLGNDPHVLFNHDAGCVLGRPSAGTARFTEDARGVHVEVEAPETTWANDLLVSMRRGDISQASASFWILQHRMEYRGNTKVRVVERAMMREASVASFPAYPSTQAVVQPAAKVSMHEMQHLEDQLRVARLR